MPALMEFVTWFPTIDHYCVDFLGGITEQELHDLNIFPNPVQDVLNLSFSESDLDAKILNAYGSVVKEFQTSPEMQLDLRGLSPGIYFIQVGDQVKSFTKQ